MHGRKEYVKSYSYFNPWEPDEFKNLDKMFLKLDHMTHVVDKKNDPKIAAQFPTLIPDTEVIEWGDHRKIYDLLQDGILNKLDAEGEIEAPNVLGMITVMQMLCDAPSMIPRSAQMRIESEDKFLNWIESGAEGNVPTLNGSLIALELADKIGWDRFTDVGHPKLEALRDYLTVQYPDDKTLVYTSWAGLLLPTLSEYLNDWGVSHVVYYGTAKQMQDAHDRFKQDDSIQVLLSSDKGSDSVDFQEARRLVHYNLPWAWTRKEQRENRNNRIISTFDTTYALMLLMENSVEERKAQVIAKKFGYHQAMVTGKQVSIKTRTLDDLLFILGVDVDR
jgi:SNF2 family DNA or RNA helicase